jgi:transposase
LLRIGVVALAASRKNSDAVTDAVDLPDDVAALRDLALRQHAKIDAQSHELGILREYIRLLKQQRFGRSSETHESAQGLLFDEAEAGAAELAEPEPAEVQIPAHARKRGGRRALPEWIERVEIVHDLEEGEKRCAEDGTRLERIGEEISEQLEFIPAQLRVLSHVRPKYACPACRTGVRIAAMPALPIPKSIASPTLLAHVSVAKYADALPLYRQEEMFRRMGIDLPRASLATWMVKCGELVAPLIHLLGEDLLASGFVQCDETSQQVLKEQNRRAQSQSYMWVRLAPLRRIVLFHYDPSRSAQVPKQLFEGYQGILQTDGYSGYDALGEQPGIVHVGCWVHARRKFDEALKAQRSAKKHRRSTNESKARQGLAFIQKLYQIERRIGDRPPDERHALRQQYAKPVMDELEKWLCDAIPRIPPQTLTGKALGYLSGQWSKLIRVLDDGRLPLDTNAVENAIRPFVVGRKNWLFSDSVRGADASANLYSLIQTAKLHGLEPFAYLRHVYEWLPRARTLAQIEALLPANVVPTELLNPRQFSSL